MPIAMILAVVKAVAEAAEKLVPLVHEVKGTLSSQDAAQVKAATEQLESAIRALEESVLSKLDAASKEG